MDLFQIPRLGKPTNDYLKVSETTFKPPTKQNQQDVTSREEVEDLKKNIKKKWYDEPLWCFIYNIIHDASRFIFPNPSVLQSSSCQ